MNNFIMPYRQSASCTRLCTTACISISNYTKFQIQPTDCPTASSFDEEALPVTSCLCQWKAPRKRKETTMRMGETPFMKHVYGKEKKRAIVPLEDFDPRPPQFQDISHQRLPELLEENSYVFR